MGDKLFGTDGIRGIVNEKLTAEIAFKVGRNLPYLYDSSVDKIKVVVGCDTRVSSDMIKCALIAGLLESGADVIHLGVVPTGGVAYLSKRLKANAGVMITASHNPFHYNGIKIFNGNGYKLTKMQEMHLETLIFENNVKPAPNEKLGRLTEKKQAISCYQNYLLDNKYGFFSGLSICLDGANGAGSKVMQSVLKRLGVKVKTIHTGVDGLKINKNCGATNLESLQNEMKKSKFNVGFALDGDADRLMILDENGEVVSGEAILYFFASYFKAKGLLKNNTIATTVMSNSSLKEALKQMGVEVIITPVGDEFVVESMLKNNLLLGGETSGHYLLEKSITTADGILSAVLFLTVLKETGLKVSELNKKITLFPQVTKNVAVLEEEKQPILNSPILKNKIKENEERLLGAGRILVRASGTEHLIRILVEGKDETLIKTILDELEQVIKSLLK